MAAILSLPQYVNKMIRSGHNFAYVMEVELSWHMQNKPIWSLLFMQNNNYFDKI